MKTPIYKKHQYGYLSVILLATMGIVYILKPESNFIPYSILGLALLVFHRLTITVDEQYVTASFFFGLIRKRVALETIDVNQLIELKTSLLYGIGIRFTPKGTLYNVKVGSAIQLKTTSGKSYLFGTDDFYGVRDAILQSLNRH